jgi:quercetin dioxygenase-like cupin family protein
MQAPSQEPTSSATIIRPEQAQVYSLMGGGEARLLVTGDNTQGAWWLAHFREDPGCMTPLHYHPKTDEYFYIVDGVLSVYADDIWHALGPGTYAKLPHGKPHSQGNRSDKPVRFVAWGTPAAFENLFPAVDALMKQSKPGTPEFMAEIQKIAARCDMVILGPAPK